jgi:AcrR family transcriptional regulator
MVSRTYNNASREVAAAAKRDELVQAAARLLIDASDAAAFSLEAVARVAGVTRTTVYKKFGSRRGLLEAVFDERARAGGLWRIPDAMARPDPAAALDQLVLIFCEFWGRDEAVARLHDIAASDVELMQALSERTERRRLLFATLLQRVGAGSAERRRKGDAADLLFALTSLAMYRSLREGRSPRAVHALLAPLCLGVLSARTR